MPLDRNNTSFGRNLAAYFGAHKYDPSKPLKYAQHIVLEYVRAMAAGEIVNGGRGLIINHYMGTGKTIMAIAAANLLQKRGHSVVVISPKTLEKNFAENVDKLSRLSGETVLPGGYNYFTLRANNLPEQIMREYISAGLAGPAVELPESASLSATFEGKVVIIDEAHLLMNSIAHGRAVALRVYRALMATKKCYVFLLTGTFIINTPFEAVPAYNLVAGREVFREDIDEFLRYFGTAEALAQNRSRFQNLVSGYLSHAVPDDVDGMYPPRLPTKITHLFMEGSQLADYYEAKQAEGAEGKRAGKKLAKQAASFNMGFGGRDDDVASSYKVRSRIASNGVNKFAAVAELVLSRPSDLMLFQCPFVEAGGVKPLGRYLEGAANYGEFKISGDGVIEAGPASLVGRRFVPTQGAESVTYKDFEGGELLEREMRYRGEAAEAATEGRASRWYFVLSGEIKPAAFAALLEILRDPINRHGAIIHVLLCSNVGNLGLDLKNGRVVGTISLGYHIEDFNQLMARYGRYGASVCLPPDQREIQPYIFVSVAPPEADDAGRVVKIPSTDEELLYRSLTKLKNNSAFIQAAHGVSIECLAGVSATPEICRTCRPNNRQLTTGRFKYDMVLPSPCDEMPIGGRKRIGVRDPDGLEHEFDYELNPLRVWEFDTDTEALVPIDAAHPMWDAVETAIHRLDAGD